MKTQAQKSPNVRIVDITDIILPSQENFRQSFINNDVHFEAGLAKQVQDRILASIVDNPPELQDKA